MDDIPAGRLSAPSLTTVATGMAVFGEHLADLVSSSVNGRPRPARPSDDVLTVIRRESSLSRGSTTARSAEKIGRLVATSGQSGLFSLP